MTIIRNGIILALMAKTPQTAIQELVDDGYSEARIAELLRESDEKCDIAQSTIHRIRTDKQSARYDVGVALIALRDRLRQKPKSSRPAGR